MRWFLLVVVLCFFAGRTTAVHDGDWIELSNFTWYNASSSYPSNSENFVLPIPASVAENTVADYLLAVELAVPASTSRPGRPNVYGSFVAVVLTSEMDELGTVQLNTYEQNAEYVADFFCWSPELVNGYQVVPSYYQIVVLHPFLPNTTVYYDVRVSLAVRRLDFGRVVRDTLPIDSVFWYFDVNKSKDGTFPAPVQVTVTTPAAQHQESGAPKTLRIYYGCPGRIGSQAVGLPEIEATFYDKVRMTIASRGAQRLQPGRWFVEVAKPQRNATLLFDVSHGLPYADYGAIWSETFLVFLLVCPAVCFVTLALVWWTQPASYALHCRSVCPPRLGVRRRQPKPRAGYVDIDDQTDSAKLDRDSNNEDDEHDSEEDHVSQLHEYAAPGEDSALLPGSDSEQPSPSKGYHTHFWELTLIVALVFFTPAIQILIGQLMNQGDYGDRDICYYNDFCERPDFASGLLMFAFNNVYSNIGYLLAGVTGALYLTVLRTCFSGLPKFMPTSYSILYALCFCLLAVGVNSGTYHLCPSRIAFQVDSAMMLGFALLSLADIWRRYLNPRLHGWRVYGILAVLLFLNYIGTIIDTYPGVADRLAPKLIYRGVLTALVVGSAAAFLWWIWLVRDQRTNRKTYTVLCLFFLFPIVLLLWTSVNADLSQTLLGVLVLLYAFSVVADLAAQLDAGDFIEAFPSSLVHCCRRGGDCWGCNKKRVAVRRAKSAALVGWMLAGWTACGISAMHYFSAVADTNKNLSPALSRNLNSDCIIADYYSTHDLWHFLSAVWLLFQLLINAHIGHGLKKSRAFDKQIESQI